MMSRIGFAALFCGACSGAHLPPVPVSPSSPASAAPSRPWQCSTPVGALVVELPEAHGLPLVGISATVLVAGARVTVGCERQDSHAPESSPSAAPSAEQSPSSAAASVP
jgi:hypothetical protein